MPVYHTTLRGTIQTASLGEIFSHSLGIQSSGPEMAVATAIRDAWITAWGTAATGLGTFHPAPVTYTEATAAKILDPTVPDLGAAAHVAFNPPLVGRGSTSMLPSQCAVAVSLTAGNRPDGRPFKGRFYLPPPSSGQAMTDGTIGSSNRDAVCVIIKNFLETLMQAGHWPSVWSRVDEDLVGVVNQVRVGNQVDTIRSRRNRYPEVYSVQAVAGPT